MKRLTGKALIVWNIFALGAALAAPMKWLTPFSAALCAAAGLAGAEAGVLPGTIAGCLLGAGGLGGILSGLAACFGAECLNRTRAGNERFLMLWAFLCALVPALARYWGRGGYALLSAAAVALVALAAAPVWINLFTRELIFQEAPAPDERIALHLLLAAWVSGIYRLCPPLGLFSAGLFVLICAAGGLLPGCAAAFPMALALILGGGEALPGLILLLSAGTAGLGRSLGRWAQSLLFLPGLMLLFYFGWEPSALFLFGGTVLLPLLPERVVSAVLRRFFPAKEAELPPYRLVAARRHLPVKGQRVSGDAGAIDLLPDRRALLILADGMGTGLPARRLSERAVREARRVLRASLDDRTAYRALNRLLLSGSNAFSTLDTCVVDLTTALASFHKCGGETAWVVRGAQARRLCGSALPLGIVPEAPPSRTRLQLRPGDLIFLATDGLVSALGGEESAEKALLSLSARAPEEVCARMLRLAQSRAPEHPDDMSALCARLLARAAVEPQEALKRKAS